MGRLGADPAMLRLRCSRIFDTTRPCVQGKAGVPVRKPGRKAQAARSALESSPGCPPPQGSTHGTPPKGRARSPGPAAAAACQQADAALNPSPAPEPDPRPAATPRGLERGRGRPDGSSAAAAHAKEQSPSPAAAAGAHAQAGQVARSGRRGGRRWGASAGLAVVAAAVASARRRNPARGSPGVMGTAAHTSACAAAGALPGCAADAEPQHQAACADQSAPREAAAAPPTAPSAVQLRSGRSVPRASAGPVSAAEPANSRAAAELPLRQLSGEVVPPAAAVSKPACRSAEGSAASEPPRKRPRTEEARGMCKPSSDPTETAPAPAPPPAPRSEPAPAPRARRAPAKWSPAAMPRAPQSEGPQRARPKRAPAEHSPGSAVAKRSRPEARSGPTPGARLPELGPRLRRTPSRWSPPASDRRRRRLPEAPGTAQGGPVIGAAPGAAGAGGAGRACRPVASPPPAPGSGLGSGLGSSARRRAAAARECTPFSPSVSVTEDLHGRHLADNPGPSPSQGSVPRPAAGQGLGSGGAGVAAEPAAERGAVHAATDTADSDPGQRAMLHPADGPGAGHGGLAAGAEPAADPCAEGPGLLALRAAGSAARAEAAAEPVQEMPDGAAVEGPAAQQSAERRPGTADAGTAVCELRGQEPAAAWAPGSGLGAASGGVLGAQQGGGAACGSAAGDSSREPREAGPMGVVAPGLQAHAAGGGSQGMRHDPDPSSAPEPSPERAACSAGPGECGSASEAAVAVTPVEQPPAAGEQAGPASEQLAGSGAPLMGAGEAAAGTAVEEPAALEAGPHTAADAAAPPNPGQGAGLGAHPAAANSPPARPACRGTNPPPDSTGAPRSPAGGHGGSPAPMPCADVASGSAPSVERPGAVSMPAGSGQLVATDAAATLGACKTDQGQGSELRDGTTDAALKELLCRQQPARSADQGQGSASACPVMDAAHAAVLSRKEHGRSMQLFPSVAQPVADGNAGPALGLGSPGLGYDGGVAPGAAAQGSVVLHAGIPSLLPALYDSDASPDPSPVSSPGPRQRSHAGDAADSMPGMQAGAAACQARQAPSSATTGDAGGPGAWLDPSPARCGSDAAPPGSGGRMAFAWCDGAPALASASPVQALPRFAQSELTACEPLGEGLGLEGGPAEPEPDAEKRFDAASLPPEDLGGCDWGDGGFWSPQPAAVLQVCALTSSIYT